MPLTSACDLVTRLACVHVGVKGVHQQAAGCFTLRDVGGVLLDLDDLREEGVEGRWQGMRGQPDELSCILTAFECRLLMRDHMHNSHERWSASYAWARNQQQAAGCDLNCTARCIEWDGSIAEVVLAGAATNNTQCSAVELQLQ
jgi:hypothetical protein